MGVLGKRKRFLLAENLCGFTQPLQESASVTSNQGLFSPINYSLRIPPVDAIYCKLLIGEAWVAQSV